MGTVVSNCSYLNNINYVSNQYFVLYMLLLCFCFRWIQNCLNARNKAYRLGSAYRLSLCLHASRELWTSYNFHRCEVSREMVWYIWHTKKSSVSSMWLTLLPDSTSLWIMWIRGFTPSSPKYASFLKLWITHRIQKKKKKIKKKNK